jgi:uncharacterized membrane protein (DUF2068 family)
MTHHHDPAVTAGIRLIVLYKVVKGALEAVGAIVLAVGPSLGLGDAFVRAALALQRHSTRAWAVHLAQQLPPLVTPGHLHLAAIALLLDAALTLVEGWGLRRGHWWGPWLVVFASGLLLPFEVAHLVRRPHVGRAMVLLANALIVAYLVWRVRVEHVARAGALD